MTDIQEAELREQALSIVQDWYSPVSKKKPADQIVKFVKEHTERHALDAYEKWVNQGRSEEQIHAVRNYLTGAYGIEIDPEVSHE